MSKNLKILFTLSIILNVLLLGAGGGFAFKEMQEKPWRMMKVQMSPEGRERMSAHYEAMRDDMAPLFAEMRKSREQMKEIMASQNFSMNEYDAITKHIRVLRQQIGDKMNAATRQLVVDMPPNDRQKMADHFVRGFGGRHGGPGDWGCKDKPVEKADQPAE